MTKARELAELGDVVTVDSGNVGFNQTSPSSYSGSGDNLVVGSSGSNGITIASGTSNSGNINFADGTSASDRLRGYIQYQHNADQLVLGTDADDRVFIDSSGNLLVDCTTATPGDNNTTTGIAVREGGRLAVSGQFDSHFNRNSDGDAIQLRRSGSKVGSISVTSSGTSYNETSDYRVKENIADITDGITRLKQLEPRRFNFIADENDTTVDGFIAHEVQTVVPEAIIGEKDAVDTNGNPDYQGIDKSKLVPLLTAALQEAVAKIETLETKVAALEAE